MWYYAAVLCCSVFARAYAENAQAVNSTNLIRERRYGSYRATPSYSDPGYYRNPFLPPPEQYNKPTPPPYDYQNFETSTKNYAPPPLVELNDWTPPDYMANNSDSCHPNFPEKPNFLVPGRRISEAKCMDYIWYIKRKLEVEIKKGLCEYETKLKKFGYVPAVPAAVGGRAAVPGEFPHMGAVGWLGVTGEWLFRCGSSLVSPKFVLTAAHCSKASAFSTDIADPDPKIVRLSHVNIDLVTQHKDPLVYDVSITKIIVHPNYKPPKKYNDIALMELDHEVGFSQMVQPACLWMNSDTSRLGHIATLTGWGVLKEGSLDISPVLQAAVVDVIGKQQCDSLLANKHNRHWSGLEEHQICAGKLSGGVDACQGDSGGPLQMPIDLRKLPTSYKLYYVIGVTSFGIGCARRNSPGVYTRVSSFADWIEKIVWP